MKIIGLSGTNGAGKDLVAAILAERYGYLFVGATEMFLDELRKRSWPTDREHKARLSAEWRREFGMGVIVDKAVEELKKTNGRYKGLVVSSLRHPGEAERVHELGGSVWWIDADPKVRYWRVQNAHRGRELEDNKTFEAFLAEEQREMVPSGDGATLNMAAVKAIADNTVQNNTNDLANLQDSVQALLEA